MKPSKDFHSLENPIYKASSEATNEGRVVQDFSGLHWKMEKMRVGQGVAEGIHLLKNELSGNDFSWNKARIPGDVYTDLYLAGEVDDPHFGRNMARMKWVQEYEWWYNYAFNVDTALIGKTITLFFEGVDYSCDVWLNTTYLGRHEGMYSSFEFDVTHLLDYTQPHVPTNLLTIKLDPPPKNQKNVAGAKHNFAGDYLTGLIPFGIWQPVKLIGTDKVKINHYRADYTLQGENVHTTFSADLTAYASHLEGLSLSVSYKDPTTKAASESMCFTQAIQPFETSTSTHFEFTLTSPKLWWPYELGEPFLYDLEITLHQNGIVLDRLTEKAGIREITMARNPGFTAEEVEFPWTFVINGKPMFLRSACWTQPSFFYGRNSQERYDFFLSKVKEANINNLRIFGWHPLETKDFYDLCDAYGITVWTNFAFATQEFRSDEPYIDLVSHEVEMSIKARRNHPSLVMFMGGEEVFFSEAHVTSHNRKLMEHLGDITRNTTSIPYGDASPLSSKEGIKMGYAPKESSHANSHYYAAGAIFMEDYYPTLDYCIIPELTAASSPSIESLKKFIPEKELWPMGISFGYHMGDLHVLQNLNYEVFGDTCMDSLENFSESTQIAQGVILQFALEHFRRQKPHVSGVSLCHFNTNWPIIKWDIIDYYGKKKRSYDYVQRSYNPILASLAFKKRRWLPGETFTGELFVVNDYYTSYDDLTYTYEILDANKKVLQTETFNVSASPNSATSYASIAYTLGSDLSDRFYITLKLSQGDTCLSENSYFFLVADQEAAKAHAKALFEAMHVERQKYGKGYYRYNPEMLDNL